jgi:hypothetical protein
VEGGRAEDAKNAAARMRHLDPACRASNVNDYIPLRRPEDIARLTEGLRKAGLLE